MKYVVVDLECTCWDRNDPKKDDHETIEIGAVFLDEKYNKVGQLDIFTWPKYNQTISQYCTDLTSITYEKLEKEAVYFSKAMTMLREKIGGNDVIFCSWGYFDKKQLLKDCEAWGSPYPFSEKHINVKQLFLDRLNRKKTGLQKAVRILGLRFNGTPHSGIDDANMVVEVFRMLQKVQSKTPGNDKEMK